MKPLTPQQEAALRRLGRGPEDGLGGVGAALVRRGLATSETIYPPRHKHRGPQDPPFTRYTLTPAGQVVLDGLHRADSERLEAERAAFGVVTVPTWALLEILPMPLPPDPSREAWKALYAAITEEKSDSA